MPFEESIWAKVAHIAGVLALIIITINLYYDHFLGPSLSIQDFPEDYMGVHQYMGVDKDIAFSFQLYNDGGKTAFISYIFVTQITGSGNNVIYSGAKAEPSSEFYIDPGATKEINITLPGPKAKITTELKIEVWYEPGLKHVVSEAIPATWG
jgi:hypothetical protein